MKRDLSLQKKHTTSGIPEKLEEKSSITNKKLYSECVRKQAKLAAVTSDSNEG